jgi:hypothetical protein
MGLVCQHKHQPARLQAQVPTAARQAELDSALPGPRSVTRRSSSSSRIYAVIKTKKNVVAAAVMISSTMRGSRRGVHPALTHWCRMSCNTVVDIPTSTPILHAERYANLRTLATPRSAWR